MQLAPDVRAQVARQFDASALEELLGTLPAAEHAGVLQSFGVTIGAGPKGETREVALIMSSSDPVQQALLDRVWAPFWDTLPAEYLDRADLPFPGREIARARRAAKAAGIQRESQP